MSLCTMHRLYRLTSHLHHTARPASYHTTLRHSSTSASSKPDWYKDVQQWSQQIYKHSQQNPVTRTSQLEPDIQHRFYATFNDTNDALQYYSSIDEYKQKRIQIHPASHLAYFVNHTATNLLADDGYEKDYQPPNPFTLRMFAGGHIQYTQPASTPHIYAPPCIGDIFTRRSQLLEQPFIKQGKSGWLVFVSVQHQWLASKSDTVVLNEIQRYVYRTPPSADDTQSKANTTDAQQSSASKVVSGGKPTSNKPAPQYEVERTDVTCDEILLFRYSALTWNAHQIHYDFNWAKSEGYKGVLVHGPLQATLCIDTIHKHITDNHIGTLKSFEYRAQRPLVANTDINLVAWRSKEIDDKTAEYTVQVVPRDGNGPAYFTSTAVVQLSK